MKNIQIVFTGLLLIITSCQQSNLNTFDQYFTNGSMRIDYFHTGDAKTESIEIDQIYRYNTWAGSLTNLIDKLNYGAYYYKIYNLLQRFR